MGFKRVTLPGGDTKTNALEVAHTCSQAVRTALHTPPPATSALLPAALCSDEAGRALQRTLLAMQVWGACLCVTWKYPAMSNVPSVCMCVHMRVRWHRVVVVTHPCRFHTT